MTGMNEKGDLWKKTKKESDCSPPSPVTKKKEENDGKNKITKVI